MWAAMLQSSACRMGLWLRGTWRSCLSQVLWVHAFTPFFFFLKPRKESWGFAWAYEPVSFHLPLQGLPKGYEDVPFYFWFNTSFIEDNKYVSVAFDSKFHTLLWRASWPPDSPQAISAQGRAGQPAQTQDLGPVQGGLWCHHVLLRSVIEAPNGTKGLVSILLVTMDAEEKLVDWTLTQKMNKRH